MLLGHIIGDFYFQTNKMAERCEKSAKSVFCHSLVYGATILVVFLGCFTINAATISLCVYVSVAHFFIDILKFCVCDRLGREPQRKVSIFVLDQCVHFATLAILWSIFAAELTLNGFVTREVAHLPALPLAIILGSLSILRPVSILIVNTNYWCNCNKEPTSPPSQDTPAISNEVWNAGKMIGYLERLIIFVLLLYGQFSTIAFVLTAKSVARFKEIEENKQMAEYYLIGTLLSVASTLVITSLLGLCKF